MMESCALVIINLANTVYWNLFAREFFYKFLQIFDC